MRTSLTGRLALGARLLRYFGPGWLAYRAGYAMRIRTGALQRQTPMTQWSPPPAFNPLTLTPSRFFFNSTDRPRYQPLLAQWDDEGRTPIASAEDVLAGRLRYFEHTLVTTGFPPDWHANPFTGQRAPADRHWSRIPDFGFGDIKVIWEPSRFGFVYALVRAYWRTGDERYADAFWRLIEDWRQHNPPNCSPNWKCGQEISFRVMAWCFGLHGFLDSETTTPERVAALMQMIEASGRRIAANFDYALSQKNNHGISEAVGLWTIGVLFPDFQEASRWAALGRVALEAQGRELIYDDGAFSQHSVNYHRLMLHDYLWALRLGDLNEQPFSPTLRERLRRAADFLYQIQDETSGQVPYYGQNDGALILPLNNCDHRDFRPVVQAAHYLVTGTRCYGAGPWDEDLLWLFGAPALDAPVDPPVRDDLRATTGGYYTLRSPQGFAFTRCGTFHHRPGQADLLHVDLWWRRQNIAVDAGTYSYNAPPPWDNALAHTVYHNTVTVDDQDQMQQVGRFLWLPWARGRVRCQATSPNGHLAYWEGEHDGYRRLRSPVCHRRGILRLGDGWWLVFDRLQSRSEHTYRLHWLFPDVPYRWDGNTGRLTLDFAGFSYHVQMGVEADGASRSLIRADEGSPRGWRAPGYQVREPALSVDLTIRVAAANFWTFFGPSLGLIEISAQELKIHTDSWEAILLLGNVEAGSLITDVIATGMIEDRLEGISCTFS